MGVYKGMGLSEHVDGRLDCAKMTFLHCNKAGNIGLKSLSDHSLTIILVT